MLAGENGKFTMWDTNGRRSDILNALTIYLSILNELEQEYPGDAWASYPTSVKQYEFYKRAISASPEVLKDHPDFDRISPMIEQARDLFDKKDAEFSERIGLFPYDTATNPTYKKFEGNIEARARHYTSNLVKIGFVNAKREITPVGREYLSGRTRKDQLEEILPIDDVNLILLRQLLKMRVFRKTDDGTISYYCPALYSMQLLTSDETYSKDAIKIDVLTHGNEHVSPTTPACFLVDGIIDEKEFKNHIKNRKSSSAQEDYYQFYQALYQFIHSQCQSTYTELISVYNQVDKDAIKKAFLSENALVFKRGSRHLTLSEFVGKNKDSIWLHSAAKDFNSTYYNQYIASKSKIMVREYGDTLFRLLTASGVFSFDKALPELLYKDVFCEFLSASNVLSNITGSVSKAEYEAYEQGVFCQSETLSTILGLNQSDVDNILHNLQMLYGVDIESALSTDKANRLSAHVQSKYPKEKVIELLGYFSDRNNDSIIQKYVNPAADIPTIYEYIVAVAWYYVSDMDFPLLQSINLTLDGNYEPAHHAGGGAGDIVIQYSDKVVMLEATLMNKAAQKRGEWEPVLRHSINLKADNEDKEVTTFFVADELDMNTTNIWRAVASVPLQATNSTAQTDHVYIMPFTNTEVASFLAQSIKSKDILKTVRQSYDGLNYTLNNNWRAEIMQTLIA